MDLGVLFTANCKFDQHTNTVIKKMHHANAVLSCNFSFTSSSVKLLLFNTFIRSIAEYCSPVWFTHNKHESEAIKHVQRKFTKHLFTATTHTYGECLHELNILSLQARCNLIDACFFHKIVHGLIPAVTLETLDLTLVTGGRFLGNIKQKFSISKLADSEYSYRIINIWNSIPNTIRNVSNYVMFRHELNLYYLSNTHL